MFGVYRGAVGRDVGKKGTESQAGFCVTVAEQCCIEPHTKTAAVLTSAGDVAPGSDSFRTVW